MNIGGEPVLALLGPTASGKSRAAMELAERFPVEIVSVDSAQVYRDMDVGTAKPGPAERARVPHHLIDVITPVEAYSAARFRADALQTMAQIRARGRVPLLVGGTMLYFKALREGLSALPSADPAVRAELERDAASRGWPALHEELFRIDPDTATRLQPNDAQRIQRALEVYRLAGRPLSALLEASAPATAAAPAGWMQIALVPGERTGLHARIAARFDEMLARGLVDELIRLRSRYALSPSMPSMRTVGYRQTWEFLEGRLTQGELRDRGIFATRQLAKRQLTWLRQMPGLTEIDALSSSVLDRVVDAAASFLAGLSVSG